MDNQQQAKLDKETLNVINDGEEIKRLVESIGWQLAKKRLVERIIDLQSVMNVAGDTAETVVIDLKARRIAVDLLLEWLKDVEGTAKQHESNKDMLLKIQHESFIKYL